jgi:multiple sugar transport system substrate-binding protein
MKERTGSMPTYRRTALAVTAAVAVGVVLALSACGSSSSSNSSSGGSSSKSVFSSSAPIRGQHITVLLPYQVSQSILNQFTKQTGVTVTYNTAGWDNVKSKLIVANTAGTYIADVTEFDWSFTGQFGGSGWYEPLESGLGSQLVSDLGNVNKAFDTKGHTYAACYSNDYRLAMYNTKDFATAGIKQFPATFSQLSADLNTLKQKKPAPWAMSMPLGATEGGLTPWYLLTLAMGGQLFNSQNKPVFGEPNSVALKALEFEISAVKNGWVSPGSVTLDDTPALNNFNAGDAAMLYAAGPGNIPTANDPSQSKIAGHATGALVPGMNGPGSSFGLPEGLAIPVTAKHKAAALAFIKWWMEPKTQTEMYTNKTTGFLPCRVSVIKTLAKEGKLQGGPAIEQELSHIVPLFPQGAPVWYSKFDTKAQQLINAAVKGEMSPSSALQQLTSYTNSVASGSF